MLYSLNWAAIITATVVAFAIGALWYSTAFFGKRWLAVTGISAAQAKENSSPWIFVVSLLLLLVAAVVMEILFFWIPIRSMFQGAILGLLLGAGIAGTGMAKHMAYENRPQALYWINICHESTVLTVMGAILGGWR